jgi:hypothetical protein
MSKNIFDHIKGVTFKKTKWDELSDEDVKSWSNYMISRFFSMEMDFVDVINYFQQYTNGVLSSKHYYTLLLHSLPKKSYYLKYVKSKNKIDISMDMMHIFCKHYELGRSEVYQYVKLLVEKNPKELINILKKYGIDDDQISVFKKQLKIKNEE